MYHPGYIFRYVYTSHTYWPTYRRDLFDANIDMYSWARDCNASIDMYSWARYCTHMSHVPLTVQRESLLYAVMKR